MSKPSFREWLDEEESKLKDVTYIQGISDDAKSGMIAAIRCCREQFLSSSEAETISALAEAESGVIAQFDELTKDPMGFLPEEYDSRVTTLRTSILSMVRTVNAVRWIEERKNNHAILIQVIRRDIPLWDIMYTIYPQRISITPINCSAATLIEAIENARAK